MSEFTFLKVDSDSEFLETPANELAGFLADRHTGLSLPMLTGSLGRVANSGATRLAVHVVLFLPDRRDSSSVRIFILVFLPLS